MGILIQPYEAAHVPAVREFNRRLIAGGVSSDFQFPESHIPDWLPNHGQRRIYQEFYLAVEESAVRGAFILKSQDFSFSGQIQRLAYYHLPISEGLVNKAYTTVGVKLLRTALDKQPLLFALGMGGYDQPLPKMLIAMGWSLCSVPFVFRVQRPSRFLRNIRALRQTKGRRIALDLAALTGAGRIALTAARWIKTRMPRDSSISSIIVPALEEWADTLWDESKAHYGMSAVRDRHALNILYPSGSDRFIYLKVLRSGSPIGWAVLLDTPLREHKQFGDMRLGSIVDCFAAPADAAAVVNAATAALQERGVDLIVSNQSHAAWLGAFGEAGYFTGPSNFLFAASKALSALLDPFDANCASIHLNRGDGDGPIHL